MSKTLKLADLLNLMDKRISEIRIEIEDAEKTQSQEILDTITSELMSHALYICESLQTTKEFLEGNLLLYQMNNDQKAIHIIETALNKFNKTAYPPTQDLVNKECNHGCCP